jgi:Family of unknown function (DUF5906)/Bifunctional DNA primase/polymerase, N-terminal/Primase C terminal 2 (PriCT-2)
MSDYLEKGSHAGEDGVTAAGNTESANFDSGENLNSLETSKVVPSKHDAALLNAHIKAGHDLIPLIGKRPAESGWRRNAPLPASKAKARLDGGQNIGVRLRGNVLVIDVDPRNFEPGDDPYARLEKDFGLSDAPLVRTGGGGFHCYCSKPAEIDVEHHLEGYRGIEFSSVGRLVVAAGSIHPDTMRLYSLDDDPLALSLSEAAEAPVALLDAIRKRPEETSTGNVEEISPMQLEKLLSKLDVTNYGGNHDDWFKIMAACHHSTGGAGVDEFVEWSVSDAEYINDEAEIRKRWQSLGFKPNAIKLGTLLKALSNAGRGALIEEVLRSPAEDDFKDEPELPLTAEDLALAEMNKTHFTVLEGGKYLVGRERMHPTLGTFTVDWFGPTAVRSHLDSRTVTLDSGNTAALGSWWAKHPRRRQYDAVTFDPSPTRKHVNIYNLWRGWAVEPVSGDWSLLKRLLLEVLCAGDQAAFDYVLRWSAFMVQRPEIPAEVALVFKGSKGAGKGTFARALRDLAGMHGKQVAQPEHFVGRFNEHLQDCILLFVDEGFWAGDPKAAGALKNLITEPVLTFEPKGKPIVSGPNMLHVVIASNEDWIVPASTDERRFAVFEASTVVRKNLPPGFFDDLNKQMKKGGIEALLYDLLKMELGSWHPRDAIPHTQALVDQKLQAFRRDPMAFWWHGLLETAGLELKKGKTKQSWEDGDVDVNSTDKQFLAADLSEVARSMRRHGTFSLTAVAQFLRKVGVDVEARDRTGNRVWRVPRLVEARAAFEDYVGGKLEWGND